MIFFFILLTTDFETPVMAAIYLWECLVINNNVFTSTHFLGDVSEDLAILIKHNIGVNMAKLLIEIRYEEKT